MAIYDTMQFIDERRRHRAPWAWPRRWASSCCRAGSQGQALRAAARADPDAPAVRPASAAPRPTSRSRPSRCCYTKRMMAELIALHTGQTVEQIEADSDRDRWFTADGGAGLRLHRPGRSRGASQVPGGHGAARNRRTRSELRMTDHAASSAAPVHSALRPAVLRRAHELRGQGVQPVQQALRGAHHLPRRADRRRVGQRRDGPAARAGVRPTRTATSPCTSTRRAARSPR